MDVAVFCLSLMGINYPSYLQEAHRVLKPGYANYSEILRCLDFIASYIYLWMTVCSGWLLIAEVKSRLDPNTGGADPVKFVKAVCELGYTSVLKVYMFSPDCCSRYKW